MQPDRVGGGRRDGAAAAVRTPPGSGVRLGQLRRIAFLETGFPLLLTALAGMAVALLLAYATVRFE